MKNLTLLALVSVIFYNCSSAPEKAKVSETQLSESADATMASSSNEQAVKSTTSEIQSDSKIKSPFEIVLDYPEKLESGKSYQAKINYRAHKDVKIISVEYSAPEAYKGSKPTVDKSARLLKANSEETNSIPFTIQKDIKDGFLVVTATFSYNDKVMKTTSSIRLFADEYLNKGKDVQIKEQDGSTTNLKILQN